MQNSQTALRGEPVVVDVYGKVFLVDGPFNRSHGARPSASAGIIRLEP